MPEDFVHKTRNLSWNTFIINPFDGSNEMKEAEYKKFNIKISDQPNTELVDSSIYASLNQSGESIYIIAQGDMGDNVLGRDF